MSESSNIENDQPLNLGSLMLKDIRSALSGQLASCEVTGAILIKLADSQGLHSFAAKALKEIKKRQQLAETAYVVLNGRTLLVTGDVSSKKELGYVTSIETFSSPSTEICNALSDDEISFLQCDLMNK